MVRRNSQITIKDKELLKKNISKLSYNEHCEIFNIIRGDTDKISENSNGVFVNLKYLKDETLIKISDFVKYCNNNKKKNQSIADSNVAKTIDKKINSENLVQNYESYSIDSSESKNKLQSNKFVFKNYIDKLSLTSTSTFSEETKKQDENLKTNIPSLHYKKLKLSGVRERIMRRCRNISKSQITSKTADNPKKQDENDIENDSNDEPNIYENLNNDYNELQLDLNFLN